MKKILLLTIVMVVAMSSFAFAYKWVDNNGVYSIYDDTSHEKVKSALIDTGEGVYYFDEDGNMVTGWWENASSGKVYFFNNNPQANYGSMTFGLRMVDGYYRYFTDDGSVAVADKIGEYKKVYLEFYADAYGNIYFNNVLMRDVSTTKSEFYSDPIYYTDEKYNNAYFAEHGNVILIGVMMNGSSGKTFSPGSQTILSQGDFSNGKSLTNTYSEVAGGTNYHIDDNGRVVDDTLVGETSEFEFYGPGATNAPAP